MILVFAVGTVALMRMNIQFDLLTRNRIPGFVLVLLLLLYVFLPGRVALWVAKWVSPSPTSRHWACCGASAGPST